MRQEIYQFDSFRISPFTRTLSRNDQDISLTGREFDTLWALVQHPGVPLDWTFFSSAVWKETTVTQNNLRQQISSLRHKLGHGPDGKDYIITVPNHGYQLTAIVEPISNEQESLVKDPRNDSERQPAEEVASPELDRAIPDEGSSSIRVTKTRSRSLAVIGLCAVVSVMGWGILGASRFLPKEMQVLSYRQLTRDGRPKFGGVFSDGSLIYFNELIDGNTVIASVPVTGGSTTLLATAPAVALAISTSKNALLVAANHNELYEIQLGSLSRRQISLPAGVEVGSATWDPGGRRIAVCSIGFATIIEPWRPTPPLRIPLPGQGCGARWDNEGRRLRFAVYDSKSDVNQWWEVAEPGATPRQLGRFTHNLLERSGIWTSDGKSFVFEAGAENQTRIWVRDEVSKPPRTYQITVDAQSWRDPTVLPGGNTVVAIAGLAQGQLFTLPVSGTSTAGRKAPGEPQTGQTGGKLVLPGVPAYELDYSRDGQWVTYTLFPEHTIWRSHSDGSDPRQLSPAGMEAHQPHWSPDGSRIAFMGKRIKAGARWRVYLVSALGGELVMPKPEGDDEGVPTWSGDGRSLVFGDLNSVVGFEGAAIHQIDLETGEFSSISTPVGMWSPRMSPDGKFLAAVSFDSKSLYIRDNQANFWRKCVTMKSVAEPAWPQDSLWIQFAGRKDDGRGLFRISPQCGQLKQVVDLTPFEFVGAAWFGISPDRSPTGLVHVPEEIYAIDWRLRRRIP